MKNGHKKEKHLCFSLHADDRDRTFLGLVSLDASTVLAIFVIVDFPLPLGPAKTITSGSITLDDSDILLPPIWVKDKGFFLFYIIT